MGIQYFSSKKLDEGVEDDYLRHSYNIRKDVIDTYLLSSHIKFTIGRSDLTKKDYINVNQYYLVRDYIWQIFVYYNTFPLDKCLIREKFKVDCVKNSLNCLSKDLVRYFEELVDYLELDIVFTPCTDDENDCAGIGEMIIEDEDDTIANIVGGCDVIGEEIEDLPVEIPSAFDLGFDLGFEA